MIFFFRTNVLNICFSCPIPNMILFGVLRRAKVPPAYQVRKRSWKWIMWGGIRVRGFTGIHFLPQAKTLTTEYYIDNLLEKEWSLSFNVKIISLVMKQQTTKIVQFKSSHDVRPRRGASTRSQGHPSMVQKKNLPNVIEKTSWLPNSPDINLVENLSTIMEEVVYNWPSS